MSKFKPNKSLKAKRLTSFPMILTTLVAGITSATGIALSKAWWLACIYGAVFVIYQLVVLKFAESAVADADEQNSPLLKWTLGSAFVVCLLSSTFYSWVCLAADTATRHALSALIAAEEEQLRTLRSRIEKERGRVLPAITLVKGNLASAAQGERAGGLISGVQSQGPITSLLAGLSQQVGAAGEVLERSQEEKMKLAEEASDILSSLRGQLAQAELESTQDHREIRLVFSQATVRLDELFQRLASTQAMGAVQSVVERSDAMVSAIPKTGRTPASTARRQTAIKAISELVEAQKSLVMDAIRGTERFEARLHHYEIPTIELAVLQNWYLSPFWLITAALIDLILPITYLSVILFYAPRRRLKVESQTDNIRTSPTTERGDLSSTQAWQRYQSLMSQMEGRRASKKASAN